MMDAIVCDPPLPSEIPTNDQMLPTSPTTHPTAAEIETVNESVTNNVPTCSDMQHLLLMTRNLKALKDNRLLCDIELNLKDCKVSAHKCVLAAASKTFKTLLAKPVPEAHVQCIDYPIDSKVFQIILDYIYTGCLPICLDDVKGVILHSEELGVHGVKEFCFKNLEMLTTVTNWHSLFDITIKSNFKEAWSFLEKFAIEHFMPLANSGSFKNVSYEYFSAIISAYCAKSSCDEETLLKYLLEWLSHSESRKCEMDKLFLGLELEQIDNNDFLDSVFKDLILPKFLDKTDIQDKLRSLVTKKHRTEEVLEVGADKSTKVCENEQDFNNDSATEIEDTKTDDDIETKTSSCRRTRSTSGGTKTESNINSKHKRKAFKPKRMQLKQTSSTKKDKIVKQVKQKRSCTAPIRAKRQRMKTSCTQVLAENIEEEFEELEKEERIKANEESREGLYDEINDSNVIKIEPQPPEETAKDTTSSFSTNIKRIRTSENTTTHRENHKKQQIYACTVSGCKFSSRFRCSLLRHKQTVHDKSHVRCKLCGTTMPPDQLDEHKSRLHNTTLRCDICEKKTQIFHRPRVYSKRPTRVKKAKITRTPLPDETTIDDVIPEKNAYDTDTDVEQADDAIPVRKKRPRAKKAEKESEMLQCTKCSRRFATPSALKHHQKGHGAPAPMLCEHCGFSSIHYTTMNIHRRLHDTSLQFPCTWPGCDYRTARHTRLQDHMDTHQGIKNHVCSTCGKAYAGRKHLNRHEQSHKLDKMQRCEECKYETVRRDKLRDHIKKHHPGTAIVRGYMHPDDLSKPKPPRKRSPRERKRRPKPIMSPNTIKIEPLLPSWLVRNHAREMSESRVHVENMPREDIITPIAIMDNLGFENPNRHAASSLMPTTDGEQIAVWQASPTPVPESPRVSSVPAREEAGTMSPAVSLPSLHRMVTTMPATTTGLVQHTTQLIPLSTLLHQTGAMPEGLMAQLIQQSIPGMLANPGSTGAFAVPHNSVVTQPGNHPPVSTADGQHWYLIQ